MRVVRCNRLPSAGRSLALAGTAAVLVSCAINYATAPHFERQLLLRIVVGGNGGNGTTAAAAAADRGPINPLSSFYSRAVSVGCFASAAVGWSRYSVAAAAYGARLRAVRAYSSTAAAAAAAAPAAVAATGAFAAAVLAANALLIVPVNAFRLWNLVAGDPSASAVLFYYKLARYAQNAVSCLWECRFVVLCHALCAEFGRLNRDMEAVGRRIADLAASAAVDDDENEDDDDDDDENENEYGNRFGRSRGDDSTATDHRLDRQTTVKHRREARHDYDDYDGCDGDYLNRSDRGCDHDDYDCDGHDDDNDDGESGLWVAQYDEAGDFVYLSRATGRPLTAVVERFKIRHRLIREAMGALKYAFDVPIGASLCILCIMAMYDIYFYSQHFVYDKWSHVYITLWLTQYTFRFFTIVATAHATTKQALRSKLIVSLMIRNCLDSAAKEELQIFYSQISKISLEFTIYDLFILKTQLLTSAIGACITYLIIIIQLKSDYEEKNHLN